MASVATAVDCEDCRSERLRGELPVRSMCSFVNPPRLVLKIDVFPIVDIEDAKQLRRHLSSIARYLHRIRSVEHQRNALAVTSGDASFIDGIHRSLLKNLIDVFVEQLRIVEHLFRQTNQSNQCPAVAI